MGDPLASASAGRVSNRMRRDVHRPRLRSSAVNAAKIATDVGADRGYTRNVALRMTTSNGPVGAPLTPDFYEYEWLPLVAARLADGTVTVEWADGATLECYSLWLAENAPGLGVEPQSREGMIDPADLPPASDLLDAAVGSDGDLVLSWSGGLVGARAPRLAAPRRRRSTSPGFVPAGAPDMDRERASRTAHDRRVARPRRPRRAGRVADDARPLRVGPAPRHPRRRRLPRRVGGPHRPDPRARTSATCGACGPRSIPTARPTPGSTSASTPTCRRARRRRDSSSCTASRTRARVDGRG